MMDEIVTDLTGARAFVEERELTAALERADEAFARLTDGSGPGQEWLGWRRILDHSDRKILEEIHQHAGEIRDRCDIFIVCGIGGSYLGGRAVIEALRGNFPKEEEPQIVYAGHHMGGRYLQDLIGWLDRMVESRGSRVAMNVISKSGTTLETALAFRLLREWFEKHYGAESSERIVTTTAPEGGVLNRLADESGYRRYAIPEDVGGRYSVLTPVGLLPSAVAGVDTDALFEGAENAFSRFEHEPGQVLTYAALRYCFHEQGKAVDLIGSFEPELKAFSGWIQQLFGESEGKGGCGLFPAGISYSTDLHSLGQMVQQGRRNMIETILEVEEPMSDLLPGNGDGVDDGLGYLADKPLYEVNRQALEGTVEAHRDGGVPVIRIRLERMAPGTLGSAIYFFELATAVYVYMLGLNPFDQPGVEAYKKAMYRNLGREGQ